MLTGAPALLELPPDRPRPPVQSLRGATIPFAVPGDLSEAALAFGRRAGVTSFMTLLAVYQALLARYAGVLDVAVGTPIAGRHHVELERLIGFFTNTLVLRTEIDPEEPFRSLLERVRDTVLTAYDHQHLPFEKLVEELEPRRSLAHSPLVQVMLVHQDARSSRAEGDSGEAGELAATPVDAETETAKFDLTLAVAETDRGMVGSVEYAVELFDRSRIVRLQRHFLGLLEAAIDTPDRPLASLGWLSRAERQQAVHEWNDTAEAFPGDRRLEALIRERAEAALDAVALVFEERQVSYGELVRRAARLGGHLRALGVGPERGVGIFADRSIATAVALLGVLEAGGYSVPLDPDYPEERLTYMAEDAGIRVVLSPAAWSDRVPASLGRRVALDDDGAPLEEVVRSPRIRTTGGPPTAWPTLSTRPAPPAVRRV